jgi:GntR family transcriptional repressor for pyruvate dehydrogenase complex
MTQEQTATVVVQSVYRTVRTSRLYEQIVQQIEESILGGALKPGDQLPPERGLAQQFGVSRTAVREAVKCLREKGLLEAFSGKGTFVTNSTSQAIRQSLDLMTRIGQPKGFMHLVDLRQILEPEIAALAATRMDDQLLCDMREAVFTMDIHLHDADAFIEADLDFHLALAKAADNPLVLSLLDSIIGLLREQRLRIFRVDGGPERGQFHHKRILEAVERRSPEAAREHMRAHLWQVHKDSTAAPCAEKNVGTKRPLKKE